MKIPSTAELIWLHYEKNAKNLIDMGLEPYTFELIGAVKDGHCAAAVYHNDSNIIFLVPQVKLPKRI